MERGVLVIIVAPRGAPYEDVLWQTAKLVEREAEFTVTSGQAYGEPWWHAGWGQVVGLPGCVRFFAVSSPVSTWLSTPHGPKVTIRTIPAD